MKSFSLFLIESHRDVVVTIPKSQYKNDDIENKNMEDNNLVQFWNFKRLPKDIGIGSKVYFVKNSEIESYMTIFKIEKDKTETCTTTGREWKGNIVYMKDLHYLKNKIPYKGFQGYRYYER